MQHGTLATGRRSDRKYFTATGFQLEIVGAELAQHHRDNLAVLVKERGARPQPKEMVRGVERGHPASLEQFAKAEALAVSGASREAVLNYVLRGWSELRRIACIDPQCTDEVVNAEIDAQAAADKEQQRMRLYIATSDRVGLQRCVEVTARHAWTAYQMFDEAVRQLMLAEARHNKRGDVA